MVHDFYVKVALDKTSRYTTVQGLATIVVIAGSLELLSKVIDRNLVTRFMKCKGAASWKYPCRAPLFPAMLSTIMPVAIRLGNACGLIVISGDIPDSLNPQIFQQTKHMVYFALGCKG
jgi:hypothetical protein